MATTKNINAGVPSLGNTGETTLIISAGLGGSLEQGTVCWGHDTGVTEQNVKDFADGWTGYAAVAGSGDAEYMGLNPANEAVSPTWFTGTMKATIEIDHYGSGSGPAETLHYKTGVTKEACEAAGWTAYSGQFNSTGWVKIRITANSP